MVFKIEQMITIAYIILGIVLFAATFFGGFFFIYFKVPALKFSKEFSDEKKKEILDNWFSALQAKGKFNGVVLVAKEEKSILAKGYGFTNHERKIKLNENSSLRLASVSKQFTAAGIMLLQEKGKLEYDDLVSVYIKDFPYEEVTIRNLLNQTSGIPDIYMELATQNKKEIKLLTNQIAVDLIVKEKRKADSKPNEKFEYSNTNYIILGRLIEIISGLSFEDYMKTELFEPLGMKNTRVWNLKSKTSTFENKADDFETILWKRSKLESSFLDGVAGDGAVFSSANDMLIWDSFWYENSLLSPSNIKEAFKKPILNNGEISDYGFGWMVKEKVMWHNGSWLGATTITMRNTENKRCLVVLDNSSNIFFDKIIDALVNANKP